MKKKVLLMLMLALTLTGCHTETPTNTTEPEQTTIAEETTKVDIELNIDNADDSMAPQRIIIGEDGEALSEQEIKEQELEQQELISEQATITEENNVEQGTVATETISYEEMQKIGNGVETYVQEQTTATMRQTAKTEVTRLKAEGIISFQNITDEMIDSYSKEELDNLMIEIYKNIKY